MPYVGYVGEFRATIAIRGVWRYRDINFVEVAVVRVVLRPHPPHEGRREIAPTIIRYVSVLNAPKEISHIASGINREFFAFVTSYFWLLRMGRFKRPEIIIPISQLASRVAWAIV